MVVRVKGLYFSWYFFDKTVYKEKDKTARTISKLPIRFPLKTDLFPKTGNKIIVKTPRNPNNMPKIFLALIFSPNKL